MKAKYLKNKLFKFGLIVTLSLLLMSCETVGYYSQSVVGHSKLMLARQPIDKAINKVSEKDKPFLVLTKSLRQYAVDELGLPANNSYLSYVDLKRQHPVWSVVAVPEFSIHPEVWCYPVIGCASYRGYFSEKAANRYAAKMQKKGLETLVGGVTAYSTLGWFNDPLIPTMFRYGEIPLAEVIFHELAHQQLYVNGNSAFNEAFATVVGEHGTLQWLRMNRPDQVAAYQERMQVRNDFSELIKSIKLELKKVYQLDITELDKRQRKQAVFSQLKQDYDVLKAERWQGKAWYGGWFKRPINNARLAAFATYRDLVPQFEALLAACENDFPRFYQTVALQKRQGKDAIIAKECMTL